MADIALIFGWQRSGTTHLGRCLSLCPDVEWHGEFLLRRKTPPEEMFPAWLDSARASRREWVVGKILPDHVGGFDAASAARDAGIRVAWAGRANWSDCVRSMERGHFRGAWHFPLRTFPPVKGVLPDHFRNEGGFMQHFFSVFPDAPSIRLEDYNPTKFLNDWLGVVVPSEPRVLGFSAPEPLHEIERT